jgi:hypothetical protein
MTFRIMRSSEALTGTGRKISSTVPNWAKSAAVGKLEFTIRFNRAADRSTLTAPGTVNIDVGGDRDHREVKSIAGTFQWSPASRVAAFISDRTKSDIIAEISPVAAENLYYKITVRGSGTIEQQTPPFDVVRDASGEALDGDYNNVPGGDFFETAVFIYG